MVWRLVLGWCTKDSQGNTSGTERPAPRARPDGHRPPDSDWCPGPRRAPRLSPHSLVPPVGFYTTNNFTKKRALKGKRRKRPGEGHVAEQVPSSGRAGCGKLRGTLQTRASAQVQGNSTTCQAPCQLSAPGLGGALSLRAPHPQAPNPRMSWDPNTRLPAVVGPCTLNSAHPFFTHCLLSTAALWGRLQRGSGGGWAWGSGLAALLPGDRAWWSLSR